MTGLCTGKNSACGGMGMFLGLKPGIYDFIRTGRMSLRIMQKQRLISNTNTPGDGANLRAFTIEGILTFQTTPNTPAKTLCILMRRQKIGLSLLLSRHLEGSTGPYYLRYSSILMKKRCGVKNVRC